VGIFFGYTNSQLLCEISSLTLSDACQAGKHFSELFQVFLPLRLLPPILSAALLGSPISDSLDSLYFWSLIVCFPRL
jgi:hypothetical protein